MSLDYLEILEKELEASEKLDSAEMKIEVESPFKYNTKKRKRMVDGITIYECDQGYIYIFITYFGPFRNFEIKGKDKMQGCFFHLVA